MLRSLTSMSFQYARNANPESFLTNWLHWLSDMFVTVRIGKIFWLMSLRKQSFFSNLCTVWLCESLHSVTVWVMREVIGNGWERRSGQKRELRANERSPKTGNRPKMGKLQNQVNQVKQVEKSEIAIFLLKKRCCYDQVVMQQDSRLSTTSILLMNFVNLLHWNFFFFSDSGGVNHCAINLIVCCW